MVYDWNRDSPAARLVSALLPGAGTGFPFPVEVLAMALSVLEAFLYADEPMAEVRSVSESEISEPSFDSGLGCLTEL